jgi:hypothetical protein
MFAGRHFLLGLELILKVFRLGTFAGGQRFGVCLLLGRQTLSANAGA